MTASDFIPGSFLAESLIGHVCHMLKFVGVIAGLFITALVYLQYKIG
jgi:hypothetical protein